MLQNRWTLHTLTEISQTQKENIVWFHFYEVHRTNKFSRHHCNTTSLLAIELQPSLPTLQWPAASWPTDSPCAPLSPLSLLRCKCVGPMRWSLTGLGGEIWLAVDSEQLGSAFTMTLTCLQEFGPSHFANLKVINNNSSRWWSRRTYNHLLPEYQNPN